VDRRPEEKRWQEWIDDQRSKIFDVLGWFETNSRTLDSPNLNIAHLALMSGIGYIDFRFGDAVDWRKPFPNVSAWFARLEGRHCFSKTRPEPPPSG
jgi:glutathione S-transferase